MKTIIASLICAVVAIGCIGLAPSKAEAGWYGRGVGVISASGLATATAHTDITATATVHTGITAIGDTGITATAPIADTGRAVLIVDGAEHGS